MLGQEERRQQEGLSREEGNGPFPRATEFPVPRGKQAAAAGDLFGVHTSVASGSS